MYGCPIYVFDYNCLGFLRTSHVGKTQMPVDAIGCSLVKVNCVNDLNNIDSDLVDQNFHWQQTPKNKEIQ